MFVLSLTYTAPLDAVDALLPEHREWLAKQYDAGKLLAWGRKVPRVGGMIFAKVDTRDEAEALAASDPFAIGGVARTEVIEFAPTFVAPGMEALQG